MCDVGCVLAKYRRSGQGIIKKVIYIYIYKIMDFEFRSKFWDFVLYFRAEDNLCGLTVVDLN